MYNLAQESGDRGREIRERELRNFKRLSQIVCERR